MVRRVRPVDLPNSPLGGIMPTPESRKSSEDEEDKVVTKKPYSAPTLVELGGSLTSSGLGAGNDSTTHQVS